eukprot:221524-Chlamydomonas_euryale.AAC.3
MLVKVDSGNLESELGINQGCRQRCPCRYLLQRSLEHPLYTLLLEGNGMDLTVVPLMGHRSPG